MTKMLKASEPRRLFGKLVVLIDDSNKLLKNGARFVDENGQLYTVINVCMPTYANGMVDVVFDGPDGIGNTLVPQL